MKPSAKCVALVKESEGCKLKAYKDPVEIFTIAFGHTRGVCAGLICTQEQADAWLLEDLNYAAALVRALVKVSLSQGQFDALTDFVFNLGPTNLKISTLLRKLNQKDYAGASKEFDKWVYAKKVKLPGLVTRRQKERELFDTPV